LGGGGGPEVYGTASQQRDTESTLEAAQPRLAARRLAVVARDWLREKSRGLGKFRDANMGFAPHFAEIARAASRHRADTLLFSLWTHDADKLGALPRAVLFPRNTGHKAAIVGVRRNGEEDVEVWLRSRPSPVRLRQQFAKSSDSRAVQQNFVERISERVFGSSLVLLCGESNIVRTQRGTSAVSDEFGVLRRLRASGVDVILNPIHDYMRRYEMPLKRQALAASNRTVVSVWNRGCKEGSEGALPWAAYQRGKSITERIRELDSPVASQPGVRIGIIDLR